jgi:uncharacterized protein (TIGR00251 family)
MTEPTTRLRLRVSPGAMRTEIAGRHGDGWKVRVSAAPERGRANEAVVGLLAERLGVPRESLSVVAGVSSRDKVVELRGLGRDEAERRLERPFPAKPETVRQARARRAPDHLRPEGTERA